MLLGDDHREGRGLPRSIVVFGALAAGLALGRYVGVVPSTAWFALACVGCAVAGIAGGAATRAGLTAAAVAFGAGWFTLRIHEVPAGALAERVAGSASGTMLVTLEGMVLETPRTWREERTPLTPPLLAEPAVRFGLRVTGVRTDSGLAPVRGRVSVRTADLGDRVVRAGDRVAVTGRLVPPAAPANPGEADRRLWAAQNGEAGTLRLPSASLIEPLPDGGGAAAGAYSALLRWRASLHGRVRSLLAGEGERIGEGRALLGALLLGEEDPALREVRSAFTRLGLAHVIAISGFHMAVMASVALFAVRLTGDRGWLEPALVGTLVAAYLAILPVSAPVWRAGVMVIVLLLAEGCGRRYDRLAVLGWIAAGMVVWRPMDLWSIGFQLSFGLVGVLMWLGARTHGRIWGTPIRTDRYRLEPRLRTFVLDRAKQFVSASVLCCVAAAPLVAYHTGLVSPLSVLTGVVVALLVTLLLYGGYAAVLLGLLVPALGSAAGGVLEALAEATVWTVRWADAAPGTSFGLPRVSLAWAGAATALALYWFARGHRRDGLAWSLTVVVAAWLGAEVWLGPRMASRDPLRIDTLAVGDGSCHLIRSGGEAMLWDCGSLTPGVGRALVPRAVRALGAWRVPTVVVSHPDLDHFNALADAARPLGVRTVLVGEAFLDDAARRPDGPESYLMERLRGLGVEVRAVAAGDSLRLGGTTVTFLSPPAGAPWPEPNDRSLVALLETTTDAGVRRALMTGDIQRRAMEHLTASYGSLRVEILEAPHHGSAAEPAPAFVSRLGPSVVLQSTGPRRADDPRWASVRAGRAWRTTATDGASWAALRRDGTVASGSLRRR